MRTIFGLGATLALAGLVACGNDNRQDLGDGGTGGNGDLDTGPPVDTLPCGQLVATFRDFQASHPDFEEMQSRQGDDIGIVETMLGADNKPVKASAGPSPQMTVQSRMSFDDWYNDMPGTNMSFTQPITLTENPPGTFTFEDPDFFPLDGMGFSETFADGNGTQHNFHFTTEIHGTFTYRGGETFEFTGDDDVFIFVNKRLALDLGGVHGPENAAINFDADATKLGITPGNTYQFDAFHAERHTVQSNFKMVTTIDCFVIL